MEFTGERFIPEMQGQIELEHLHRYLLAKTLARGRNVLDIASGEGYGSAMLAEVANHVIGVDISEEAVKHARNKYKLGNLEFRSGSCANIPVGNASIDLVVSFETIEHHGQHDEMLSEIKRVLHPRGILIISSPDKYGYSVAPDYSNPFHVRELFRDQFEGLLRKYFKYYSMYGQRVIYGSGIFSSEPGRSFQTFEKDRSELIGHSGMPRPIYEIALAADFKLPVLDNSVFEQKFNDSEIVSSWSQAVTDRDGQIASLRQAVTERDTQLAKLAAEYEGQIASLSQIITDRDGQIASLNQIITDRDGQIASLNQAITQKESAVQELRTSLAQRDEAAQNLEATLNQIQNSHGWRTLQYYYRLRDKLLPEGSHRKNWIKFVWRVATRQPVSMPKLRLFSVANVRKYLSYCRLHGIKNATRLAFRRVQNPNASSKVDSTTQRFDWDYLKFERKRNSQVDHPLVSIVIPCYNQGQFLAESVNSAIAAYAGELEIIIIDDGSDSPLSLRALRDIHLLYPQVKVIRQDNKGLAEARNTGILSSSGTFVQFLDADDVLVPGKIDAQIEHLLHVGKKVSICNYLIANELLCNVRKCEETIKQHPLDIKTFLYRWERGLSIPIHCGLFARDVFDQVKFNPSLTAKEDWVFWCDLAKNGNTPAYLDIHGAVYRLHGANMTQTSLRRMSRNWIKATIILDEVWGKHYPDFLESSFKWLREYYLEHSFYKDETSRLIETKHDN